MRGDRKRGAAAARERAGRQLSGRTVLLMLVLPVTLCVLFIAYPTVESGRLSFYSWPGIGPEDFVGFRNFRELFHDSAVGDALVDNVIFAVLTTAGTVGIGLLVATAIDRRVPAWRLFKVVCFLPVIVPMTVTGLFWANAYDSHFGAANTFLGWFSDAWPRAWLADSHTALYAVIVVAIWQFAGFPMILILAAMEGISPEIHEAATLDGVGTVRRLRDITLPQVMPVIAAVTLLQLIFSLKVFDLIWVMTQGGPAGASHVLGTLLYDQAFRLHRFGYASTLALATSVLIVGTATVYMRLVRSSTTVTA